MRKRRKLELHRKSGASHVVREEMTVVLHLNRKAAQ